MKSLILAFALSTAFSITSTAADLTKPLGCTPIDGITKNGDLKFTIQPHGSANTTDAGVTMGFETLNADIIVSVQGSMQPSRVAAGELLKFSILYHGLFHGVPVSTNSSCDPKDRSCLSGADVSIELNGITGSITLESGQEFECSIYNK